MVRGIESKPLISRILWLLIAVGFLFVVGLTVSRGALVGVALATVIATWRTLRRSVAPLLLLFFCVLMMIGSGLFDRTITFYEARQSEETGRLLTWPLVMSEVAASPLSGIGVSHAGLFVAAKNKVFTPHNGFLFLAMTGGILPVLFFSRYWWLAGKRAIRATRANAPDAPFVLPLVVFAFVTTSLTNQAFTVDWVIVTLAIALTQDGIPHVAERSRMAALRHRRHAVGPAIRRHSNLVQS
jgi:O-antigen ligase